MSFGDIITAWVMEQVKLGKLSDTHAAQEELDKNLRGAADAICDAIRTTGDDTPLRLIAAHLGYSLESFTQPSQGFNKE